VNGYLEPRRAVMTGLTRDGTFWIENGKIAGSVGSMRFTDSLLEAFSRVGGGVGGVGGGGWPGGLTASRTLVPNWWSTGGTCAAPGVLLPGLTFTSESRAR
jgi:predicted Zn-dependent protease